MKTKYRTFFDIYINNESERCTVDRFINADAALEYARSIWPNATQINIVNHETGEQTMIAIAAKPQGLEHPKDKEFPKPGNA